MCNVSLMTDGLLCKLCNASLMSPMFALVTVFPKFWGTYVCLPFLAASFQLAIQEKLWCLRFYSKLPLVICLLCIFR